MSDENHPAPLYCDSCGNYTIDPPIHPSADEDTTVICRNRACTRGDIRWGDLDPMT
jgi:hypothetical protein